MIFIGTLMQSPATIDRDRAEIVDRLRPLLIAVAAKAESGTVVLHPQDLS
jgi:hypothetical protein